MSVENTPTDSGIAISAALQSGTDWTWTIVSLGVVLLVYSLSKLCIRQTVATNGRVQTQFVLPVSVKKWLKLRRSRKRPHLKANRMRGFTPQQRQLFAQLYSGQEIVFGVLLYVSGLVLITRGSTNLFGGVGHADIAVPFVLVIAGALVALWGVQTVVKRQKRNPFVLPH